MLELHKIIKVSHVVACPIVYIFYFMTGVVRDECYLGRFSVHSKKQVAWALLKKTLIERSTVCVHAYKNKR